MERLTGLLPNFGVNELPSGNEIPLLSRGGVAARSKKILRSHYNSRRRGGAGQIQSNFLTNTTPALRATPPRLRRGIFFSRPISKMSLREELLGKKDVTGLGTFLLTQPPACDGMRPTQFFLHQPESLWGLKSAWRFVEIVTLSRFALSRDSIYFSLCIG